MKKLSTFYLFTFLFVSVLLSKQLIMEDRLIKAESRGQSFLLSNQMVKK